MKLRVKSVLAEPHKCVVVSVFGYKGAELLGAEGRKMGVWPFWGNFKAVTAPSRWSRTPRSMIRYPGECRGLAMRLFSTAGVCE